MPVTLRVTKTCPKCQGRGDYKRWVAKMVAVRWSTEDEIPAKPTIDTEWTECHVCDGLGRVTFKYALASSCKPTYGVF